MYLCVIATYLISFLCRPQMRRKIVNSGILRFVFVIFLYKLLNFEMSIDRPSAHMENCLKFAGVYIYALKMKTLLAKLPI